MTIAPTGIIDLWTLFVEGIFGSFWISVIGLALLMYIIFILGKVSQYSAMLYLLMFFVAMTLGYGYSTLTVILTLVIFVMFLFSMNGYMERGGGQ